MACGYQAVAILGTVATALFIYYNHRRNIERFLGRKA
jgi:hypothetical protein